MLFIGKKLRSSEKSFRDSGSKKVSILSLLVIACSFCFLTKFLLTEVIRNYMYF